MPALVGTCWGASVWGADVWGPNVWGAPGAAAPAVRGGGGGPPPRSRRALAYEKAWEEHDRAQEPANRLRRRRRGLPKEVLALEVPELESVLVGKLLQHTMDAGPGPVASLRASQLPATASDLVATTSGMSDSDEEALLLRIAEVLWNVS